MSPFEKHEAQLDHMKRVIAAKRKFEDAEKAHFARDVADRTPEEAERVDRLKSEWIALRNELPGIRPIDPGGSCAD